MRFPPQTSQQLIAGIFLIGIAAFGGCNRETPIDSKADPTNESRVDEETFAQQLAEVREGTSTRIAVEHTPVSDSDILSIRESDQLVVLKLKSAEITTVAIERLTKLPQLEQLHLRDCKVDDEGLVALSMCKTLRFLNLPDGEFSDASMKKIATLPQLEMFRFHAKNVTDKGVSELLRNETLRFLHLIDVAVSDAIVEEIVQCKNLESLYIDGGKISDDGYSRIYDARPDLHMHIDQQHHDLDPNAHD